MDEARRIRKLVADLELETRRFQAEQDAAARAGGEPAGDLRRRLQPLKSELSAALQGLADAARLGRLARELADLFARNASPRAFARAALDAIGPAMRASRGWVASLDGPGESARVLASTGASAEESAELSRSLLEQVIARGEPLRIGDALDSSLREETSIVRMNLRSVLVAPLLLHGRVRGAVGLENDSLAGAFTEADEAFLTSVGSLLAPHLEVGGRLDDALRRTERLSEALTGEGAHRGVIAESPAMRAVLETVDRLSTSDVPVLIQGESGTGKEVVARALHRSGRRAAGPLVAVNCAAIPEGLMESELFGHERGAFTGATDAKAGRFERAHEGTLFLDEVGELRLELQAKLLRVLQEQSFERVGGSRTIEVDVRVVAATNRDLRQLVEEGRFREDLLYRLDVVPIHLPPLRERPEDVVPLAERFLAELGREAGRDLVFDGPVLATLARQPFPGNVRELRNLVHRLVALAPPERDRIVEDDLPEGVTGRRSVATEKNPLRRFLKRDVRTGEELKALRAEMRAAFDEHVREVEVRFHRELLERSEGNVSAAAREAGLNRTALHRKLKELGLG